jgi:glycosyltransferase involved in cell wall biosynthesis
MSMVWQRQQQVELHFMGDGDLSVNLRKQADAVSPGLNRVRFHGVVPAPYPELSHFDIFCLPSRSDNLPVAILEAMLARLPIVSTRVGGIPELVEAGGCGLLVPRDSPDRLAEALTQMIELSWEERESFGRSGESFARKNFSIESTVAQLEEVYTNARLRVQVSSND